MNHIEFVRYEPTPGERHLGIATVKLYGKIILRYKIVPTKDGSSFFPAPASYKMPGTAGTEDRYVHAFTLDSNSEREDLETLIKAHVRPHLNQSSPTVFDVNSCPPNAVYQAPQQVPPQSNGQYWNNPPPDMPPSFSQQPEPILPGFETVAPPAWQPRNDGMPF